MQESLCQKVGKSLAFLGLLLISSCASQSASSGNPAHVHYSDSRYVHLLSPGAFQSSVEENQRIAAAYGEKKFSAESWMLLNDSIVRVLVFSPVGGTVVEIVYMEDSLFMESRWMDAQKVKPEYVVADIQFCYYPANALAENFRAAGLEFDESSEDGVTVRTLRENGKVLVKMERRDGVLSIENFLRRYSYRIESEKR